MDELWQRHKTFILQCVIGGLVFLIALFVINDMYSGTQDAQVSNRNLLANLEKRVKGGQAPSKKSIDAQRRKATDAQQEIKKMASQVASLTTGEDYVRENIVWVLDTIGRPRADSEKFLQFFRQFPLTALTSVREEARGVLVARAAQKGKTIDETFGLAAGLTEEDVPGGLHALAIICDVIRRSLDRDGIQSVTDIRVQPGNVLDRDLPWITGIEVRVSIIGDPEDVMAVVRSFNGLDPHASRMIVMKEVESIARRNNDEDAVKGNIVLLGLQHKLQGD